MPRGWRFLGGGGPVRGVEKKSKKRQKREGGERKRRAKGEGKKSEKRVKEELLAELA
jgi:hypothetical protein